MSQSRAAVTRSELAVLLLELLLIGQLIDRSGMAWCIQAFGRQLQIAIVSRRQPDRPPSACKC